MNDALRTERCVVLNITYTNIIMSYFKKTLIFFPRMDHTSKLLMFTLHNYWN